MTFLMFIGETWQCAEIIVPGGEQQEGSMRERMGEREKWGPCSLENQWKSMNGEGSARLLRYTDGERAGILINFSH